METHTVNPSAVRIALDRGDIVDYICAGSALREFSAGDPGYRGRILSYANRPELESVIRQAFVACVAYMGDAILSSDADTLSAVVLAPVAGTPSSVADTMALAVARAVSAIIGTAAGEADAATMRDAARKILDGLCGKYYSAALTDPWR